MINEIYFGNIGGESLGVVLTKAPPIVYAPERGDWDDMPGMDGAFWKPDYALDKIKVKLELYAFETADLDGISAWIYTAETMRIAPRDYFWRIDTGHVSVEWEEWNDWNDAGYIAKVALQLQPWRYQYPEATPTVLLPETVERHILNPCHYYSEPLITVEAEGDIELTIAGMGMTIDDVDGSVVIDCEKKRAYDPETMTLLTTQMRLLASGSRRWPVLNPGLNAVNWSGDVEKITIAPRWRER